MRRALAPMLLCVVLAAGLTGCMDDDPARSDRGAGDHTARLEADRATAGRVVRRVAADLATELGGTSSQQRGSFRGCRGRTPEGIAAFEYVAGARVDVPGATSDELLAPVSEVLAALGAGEPEAVDVPGGQRFEVVVGGTTAGVTTREAAGPFLLVSATGGCHEVPADEQRTWLDRPTDVLD